MSERDGEHLPAADWVPVSAEAGLQWEMAFLLAFLLEWEAFGQSNVLVNAGDNALWVRLEIIDDEDANIPSRFQSVLLSQSSQDTRVVAQSIIGPGERLAEPALRAILREAHTAELFRVSIDPLGRLVLIGEFPIPLAGLSGEERESLGFWMLSEVERLALLADRLEERYFGVDADALDVEPGTGLLLTHCPDGATVH